MPKKRERLFQPNPSRNPKLVVIPETKPERAGFTNSKEEACLEMEKHGTLSFYSVNGTVLEKDRQLLQLFLKSVSKETADKQKISHTTKSGVLNEYGIIRIEYDRTCNQKRLEYILEKITIFRYQKRGFGGNIKSFSVHLTKEFIKILRDQEKRDTYAKILAKELDVLQ